MPAKNRVENGNGDSCIVTFRVPTQKVKDTTKRLQKRPIVGIGSHHQFARKLFLDYIEGKVVYLNPTDMSEDPALAES